MEIKPDPEILLWLAIWGSIVGVAAACLTAKRKE